MVVCGLPAGMCAAAKARHTTKARDVVEEQPGFGAYGFRGFPYFI
jgi:hypothetical protein